MIINRVLVLSYCNMYSYNFDNNYLLLDFATSIYVFYDKNRFINFKKATKSQKFLAVTDIIIIEGWKEIL